MKILIGTPIHISKDYAMEKWLENVSKLKYPADLLLVDNSPDGSYAGKVKSYCKKFKLHPIIKHLDFDQQTSLDTRIEASQETIRQYVLEHNYAAWFSWECDQLIPPTALNKLVKLMNSSRYQVVFHNSKARWDPTIINTNMGCTLISRKALSQSWFLPTKSGKISLNPNDSFNINNPNVYKSRVLKNGGNFAEVFGFIKPIYHLNN